MSEYEEFKEIVIKRLEAMPENVKVSMGSVGTFSREELIRHVIKDSDIGKFIVKMQIKYLRSMSRGFVDAKSLSRDGTNNINIYSLPLLRQR